MTARWCILATVGGLGPFEVATGDRDHVGGLAAELNGVALGTGVNVEAWVAELPADRVPHGAPTVHVWPQSHWHADATVAADPAGALALLAANLEALRGGTGTAAVFGTDGEGYILRLVVEDPDAEGRPDVHPAARFDVWAAPYTDPIAGGPDPLCGDGDLDALLDAFDALGVVERARVPDILAAKISVLRGRVRGPLLSDDDPRAGG